jgi:60 kDa SS-A/Ro ribonucleoprotein
MRTNKGQSGSGVRTHEGGRAVAGRPIDELRRTVCACMLWESTFYESGEDVAKRIVDLVAKCNPMEVAVLAQEARVGKNMRHAPLFMCIALANAGKMVECGIALAGVLHRADEPGEFLSLFFRDGRRPIPHAIRRGIGVAMQRFDAYQLGKYDRKGDAVKIRDVLRLVHPKPRDTEQSQLWKSVLDGTLKSPDTWEVALSGGADKRETFERLLREKRLGAMAMLRNLRNMVEAGVDERLVKDSLNTTNSDRVLPFRFIAAARHAPRFERELDAAMLRAVGHMDKIPGRTALLIDHSGSMNDRLSEKSEITRFDAACGLAIIAAGVFQECVTFAFSTDCVEVPPRQGFALRDSIASSMGFGGTHLWRAVDAAARRGPFDRIIVVTDEQTADIPSGVIPGKHAYMLNVGTSKNGVSFGRWTSISGFSESFVDFVREYERL